MLQGRPKLQHTPQNSAMTVVRADVYTHMYMLCVCVCYGIVLNKQIKSKDVCVYIHIYVNRMYEPQIRTLNPEPQPVNYKKESIQHVPGMVPCAKNAPQQKLKIRQVAPKQTPSVTSRALIPNLNPR